MNDAIIMKDLHVRPEFPFYNAISDFTEWFVEQEFNNENNYLFQLGDFFHKHTPDPKSVSLAINFLKRLKFKKIFILAGNLDHSFNRLKEYNAELILESMSDRVKVFYKPEVIEIEGISFAMLPWFYDNYYQELGKLRNFYENMTGEYDYILYHFEDESIKFGNNMGIKLSLKGKRIGGHIHKKLTNYDLGMPVTSRKDEKGMKNELLSVCLSTKKESVIDVPNLLDYYDVVHPEKPKINSKYSIINVECENSHELDEYRNPFFLVKKTKNEKNKNFYKSFYLKNSKSKNFLPDLFHEFAKKKQINQDIRDFVLDFIKEKK